MFRGEKVLAIVPARGGSKRFPGKNVFPLGGKPLIAWTLEAARASRCIDEVLVSTDSAAIADVCRASGFEVDHLRPKEFARDETSTADTVRYELSRREDFGWVALLQPTSPLRTSHQVDAAFEALDRSDASRLVSTSVLSHPASWLYVESEKGLLSKAIDVSRGRIVRPNGAIYIASRTDILSGYDFGAADALSFLMSEHEAVDIDTVSDMNEAEMLLNALQFAKRSNT